MSINKKDSKKQNESVVNFKINDTFSSSHHINIDEVNHSLNFYEFITQQDTFEPDITSGQVRAAGRALRKKEGDLKSAIETVQAFRKAHEKPLDTVAFLLAQCCNEMGFENISPLKRLKRIETIIDKLQRKSLDGITENKTCVRNMVDIGGCRVIFPDMPSLLKVLEHSQEVLTKTRRLQIKKVIDYINTPKETDCGYRSVHIHYRYETKKGKTFKIEAQLRTINQHYWATAVEIIDLLEHTNIKTHSHSPLLKEGTQERWESLLRLMSDFIADKDNVDTLSQIKKGHIAEKLQYLNNELHAIQRLSSFKMMTNKLEEYVRNSKQKHILFLINEDELSILLEQTYDRKEDAIQAYNLVEKMISGNESLNTLLVSTENMGSIAKAYPNYAGDCSEFIELLKEAMQ